MRYSAYLLEINITGRAKGVDLELSHPQMLSNVHISIPDRFVPQDLKKIMRTASVRNATCSGKIGRMRNTMTGSLKSSPCPDLRP